MPEQAKFVHLHVHSQYSLLDGLTRIDELVAAVQADGQSAVALTDHGAMYGAIEFVKVARKAGVKPIIGIEAYYAPNGRRERASGGESAYGGSAGGGKRTNHLILLAKNRTGYANLLALTTAANLEGFYYRPRIDWELLEQYHDGLIALSGCLSGELSRAILDDRLADARAIIERFQRLFGEDYFLELQRRNDLPDAKRVETALRELGSRNGVPLVATNDVHYLTAADAEAQDVLLCLQTKSKQSDRDRLSMLGENYSFRPAAEMALLFEDCPEAIANTGAIAERCNLDIELGKIQLPSYPIPAGSTEVAELRAFCDANFGKRYGAALPSRQREARDRMDYELRVISEMGYSSYFLIVQDFVGWAKRQGIIVGPGRGSAAGSIVAYLCGITSIDPLAYDLLFERFLAPGRIQMPDIDLDFADHRRDEVLAYVRAKYGEDHVAQIITFGTMAARAAIRDVGRVLDVPYTFCDRLAKLVPFGESLAEALESTTELRQLVAADETTQRLVAIAQRLEGVARHTSTHACGVVISAKPLVTYLPVQRASADDATIVTQYGMHGVEDLGLLKMDFLGLSNLSIIEHTVNLIRSRGMDVDVDALPLDDAATYQLLQRGDSTGVFQLESGGMKRYLKDLKPSVFEDIIAMISLYRPGPMELIPEYIDRKFGRKPIEYLHPRLEPVLRNTYGIMIYQEQLMSAARALAGFSLAEADVLRKAIGKKIKQLLQEQREKLIGGCLRCGVSRGIAEQFWNLIEPFDRYGFNRSHGACYALIAYQTAWLKAHYPAEFMCALLTAERGNTDRLAILIQECREMGIAVLGPDVNESEVLFTVTGDTLDATRSTFNAQRWTPERMAARAASVKRPASSVARPRAIRFGLAAVKNVGEHLVEALVLERHAHGPFAALEDLLARVQDKDFNKKSFESLIRAGALDRFGERGQLIANIDAMLRHSRMAASQEASGQSDLFGGRGPAGTFRLAPADPAPQRLRLAWEKELLGLYLSSHPFTAPAAVFGAAIASIVSVKQGSMVDVLFGGVITRTKRITTKNGESMLFAEVEDHTGAIEVVVFPRVLEATSQAWLAETIVLVKGKRSDKDGTPKVLADRAVQVIPGRERDALEQFVSSSFAVARAVRATRRLVLDLPAHADAGMLRHVRETLEACPGPVVVRVRSASGQVVSTGIGVSLTSELRDRLEAFLGASAVRDEVESPEPALA